MSSHLNPTTETDLGYGHLFAILLRRRLWFLGAFSIALIVAALKLLHEEPTYESAMQLIIEPNYRQELKQTELNNPALSDQNGQIDYATQLNLMESDRFIREAIDSIRSEYPELTVEKVQRSLNLARVLEDDVETRIFEVVYTDTDPERTKRVLEALQVVYLEYNLEQQELRLTRGLEFINRRLQTASDNLRQSQNALEQFRQNQNLIDPQQQAAAVANALNQVDLEQQSLQAQYRDAQARYTTLQQQLSLSPSNALAASRLTQSSRYQTLLNQLQQTELALAQRRVIFSDLDPSVQSLLDQRQNQIALLSQEVRRVLGQTPAELTGEDENLLTVGQLSGVDLNLVSSLAEVQSNLASLEARRQSLSQTEQLLRAELNRYPALMAQYDRLQPEVETQRTVLQQLLAQREQLSAELARGGYNWQIVEDPQLGIKIAPDPVRSILLGAVVGLFLGGIAAFLREAMDGGVHTSDDLKKRITMPLLGILPEYAPSTTNGLATHLPFYPLRSAPLSIVEAILWPPFRESFDLIYKNIQFLNLPAPPKSLMVTSALSSEGKTTVVLGLALSAARLGQRVLVIDANLRGPSLHHQLNLSNEQGLSSFLENGITEANPTPLFLSDTRIDVLTAGPASSDPVKLLSSHRMRELMSAVETAYDLILLDTTPLLGTVDALQTASYGSGVILVTQLGRVTQTELNEAVSMLSRLNVLGIVANRSGHYSTSPGTHTPQNNSALLHTSAPRNN